jgi:hypothetical protein
MKERDVIHALRARADNYGISNITLISGCLYSLLMNGEWHDAVMLLHSFQYYEKQYHITTKRKPTLIVCYEHNTVVPIPVLSMRAGNFAKAYELPEEIDDIETQRWSKLGAQVLLGMYISGVRLAQTIIKELPSSTRNRYLQKVEDLGRRKRGRPVGIPSKKRKAKR